MHDGQGRAGSVRRRYAHSETIRRLRAIIGSGEYEIGERLGSERALAAQLDISRADLRLALASLETTHEIRRTIGRGGGILVSDSRLERNINTVESLPIIARRQGFLVSSQVLSASIATASSSDMRRLELKETPASIYDIVRLRFIDETPLSLEISHLPAQTFPMLLTRDLTESFYTIFERDYDVRPCIVDETVEPMLCNAKEARLLQVPEGTPVVRIRRIARDVDGKPFERATDVYIASRVRFTMHHSGYVRLSATAKEARETKEPNEPESNPRGL
ncbi:MULTISPECIES: GntR family transcriptional regulator [Bifidobacterium]|uniref:GntR family transcriptional regulator n=1 Tax=Bifidobacterium TaxID=1678 RepID=UPI001F32B7A7|nr:GntR family transcriptional regulator [Bifidobacterium tibiigranuli]MCH3973925.1 GntR family transcriptional regulator [Bifidobacterium tibiigranuli]MCH4190338.1 GntR family transcriptional regulator [Bifidobacterium tibiigranuli]MCH4203919.1 GntR family transcriptional regulator [Bifidobacterium tibiigranuli]MCH4274239.1 GntR family transcriptional regulator [Bifidobacterium tibiigranuli]MCI1211805.1 GntR family transcriptional regulator [Bifidobacterium tibiigranuli]